MERTIIRDENNSVKYKLDENKTYNTVTIRDSSNHKIGTYNKNNGQLRDDHGHLVNHR